MAMTVPAVGVIRTISDVLETFPCSYWLLSGGGNLRTGLDARSVADEDYLEAPVVWIGHCLYPVVDDIAALVEPLLIQVSEIPIDERYDGTLSWQLQRAPFGVWADRCARTWHSADLLARFTLAELATPVLECSVQLGPVEKHVLRDWRGRLLLLAVDRDESTVSVRALLEVAGVAGCQNPETATLDSLPAWPLD